MAYEYPVLTTTADAPVAGTAAFFDVGTGADDIVQLDGTGKLPAVDGSQLTNLPAGGDLLAANNLSDLDDASTARTNLGLGSAATHANSDYATAAQGSLADSAVQPGDLGTAATLNVGTSANNVVQLNGSAQLPAVDGSLLTNLPAGSGITLGKLHAVNAGVGF